MLEVDLFLKNLERELFSINESGRNYANLSYTERRALRNLKEYSDIVIKKADKGSAVIVVWGLEEYRKEAYRQLKYDDVYEKVMDNPINKVVALIDGKLQNYAREGKITQANLKDFKRESLNLSQLHMVSKLSDLKYNSFSMLRPAYTCKFCSTSSAIFFFCMVFVIEQTSNECTEYVVPHVNILTHPLAQKSKIALKIAGILQV